MSNKLAYIYACDVFIKIGFLIGKLSWTGPRCFSPAMEIRAGHRAPRLTPQDQTSCLKKTAYTFKSDDKCSSLLKQTNKQTLAWMTEQQPLGDQIGGWNFPVQICRRGMVPAMLWRQTIPQRDVAKRYLFALETLVGWRRAVGSKKRKMKSSFPFFPPLLLLMMMM